MWKLFAIPLCCLCSAFGAEQISIRFQAVSGVEPVVCGKSYAGIGSGKSPVTLKDLRFYVHDIRLLDTQGREVPLELDQDGKWQLDDVVLIDLEDGTAGCSNGTPEMNALAKGSVASGQHLKGLRFTLGVPFAKNHSDLLAVESPLNLTAMAWVWNAGRRFARVEAASAANPRGFAFHLGSTGCSPDSPANAAPLKCASPNRVEVELPNFDPDRDVVLADLTVLFDGTDVDAGGACESTPGADSCAAIFAKLGLPFDGKAATVPQKFFRTGKR